MAIIMKTVTTQKGKEVIKVTYNPNTKTQQVVMTFR